MYSLRPSGASGPLAGAAALLLLLPIGARGQAPDGGLPSLSLSGYLHSLTGIHDTGYDVPGGDRRSAFNGELVRLRWGLQVTERVGVDVHHRVQARISSSADAFGRSLAGIGVTTTPGRSVVLTSSLIDDDRLRVDHDFDRLAVSAYTPLADLTVGRQAIAWGTSFLFPVADLWAPFSPFELDTDQKPGIDAIRALFYPADGLEMDVVVADRGSQDEWSAGVRATVELSSSDVYAAVSRVWDEVLAGGGVSRLFDTFTARGEVLVARNLDSDRWLDPRLTAGIDWLGNAASVTVEYHFNGLGASGPKDYNRVLAGESYSRGETYFLGRHYVGASASWTPGEGERIRLSGTVLANLTDGSASLLPTILWDLGSSTSITVGTLVGIGETPAFPADSTPSLQSEYGTYGTLGFTQISIYF